MRWEEEIAHYLEGLRGISPAPVNPMATSTAPGESDSRNSAMSRMSQSLSLTPANPVSEALHGSGSHLRTAASGPASTFQDLSWTSKSRTIQSHRPRLTARATFPHLVRPSISQPPPRATLPHLVYGPIRPEPPNGVTLPHLVHPPLVPRLWRAESFREGIRGRTSPGEFGDEEDEEPDKVVIDPETETVIPSISPNPKADSHPVACRGSETDNVDTKDPEEPTTESGLEEKGWGFCDVTEMTDEKGGLVD